MWRRVDINWGVWPGLRRANVIIFFLQWVALTLDAAAQASEYIWGSVLVGEQEQVQEQEQARALAGAEPVVLPGVRYVQGAWTTQALAGLAAEARDKGSWASVASPRVCSRDKGTAALPVDW